MFEWYNLSKKNYTLQLVGSKQKVEILYSSNKDVFFIDLYPISISGTEVVVYSYGDGGGVAEIWNNGNLTAVLDFVSIDGLDMA